MLFKNIILILFVYRISGFLFNDWGTCLPEDILSYDSKNMVQFFCRSANPMWTSLVWFLIYLMSIFAFDWLSDEEKLITCSNVLSTLPHASKFTLENSGMSTSFLILNSFNLILFY